MPQAAPKAFARYLFLTVLVAATSAHAAEHTLISNFENEGLAGWEEKELHGQTHYQLVTDGGKTVLQADANQSASGYFRKLEVDLRKTPYLNWRWKVSSLPNVNDELTKDGDDFGARIYVLISGGWQVWKTKALNYVWATDQQPGSRWASPYTDKSKMIAIQSGTARAGQWVTEKRNVRIDLEEVFGKSIDRIDAVAVMTDSDNSQSSASARYADIYFSAN